MPKKKTKLEEMARDSADRIRNALGKIKKGKRPKRNGQRARKKGKR